MTASVDVDKRLASLEARGEFHERLLAEQSETLRGVKDVLVQQGATQQALVDVNRRLDDHDLRLEKWVEQSTRNREQILRWSGGIAAVIAVAGLMVALQKLGVLFTTP